VKMMEEYHATSSMAQFNATSPCQKQEHTKLLIGVPSIWYESNYRDVHRRTWMSDSGVCKVSDKSPNCKVYVTFVLGRNNSAVDAQVAAEAKREGDIIVPELTPELNSTLKLWTDVRSGLACMDPVDSNHKFDITGTRMVQEFKSALWLLHASKHYPWATHVAKSDSDNYPVIGTILNDLATASCSKKQEIELVETNSQLRGEGSEDLRSDNAGMYYGQACGGLHGMRQGQFYVLSANLLSCLAIEEGLKSGYLVDFWAGEDTMVGSWVHNMTKEGGGPCPNPALVGINTQEPRWFPVR